MSDLYHVARSPQEQAEQLRIFKEMERDQASLRIVQYAADNGKSSEWIHYIHEVLGLGQEGG